MKISHNWLKSYLDFDLPIEKLSEILTDIGLEVEGIQPWESIKGGLNGLVVGHVLSAEKHPDADKLKITKVDLGNGEPVDIVCGAPNVEAGQKVIVAPINTVIYPLDGDPFKIKKAKIRGAVSEGMICAEDEIGLGKSHDGIMVLADSNEAGTAINEIFEVENDYIIEIGLTPNRNDAFSHIGVAKDLKAALQINMQSNAKVKFPDISEFPESTAESPITVSSVDEKKCWRYAGLYLSNIEIKESPNWLKNRLLAVGVRPISNVVDITNFILHELGQPLHAFDADKIEGQEIIVKSLPAGSTFLALDEKEYKLTADDLMICNANDAMCIAGVFGGLKSGVTDSTKNIFLEAACFEPINTRKTSFHHLLRTDAAQRFEKGVDPNNTIYALKRAALLMQELAGASIETKIVDIYPTIIEPKEILVDTNYIRTVIGADISNEEITNILKAMEMGVEVVEENQLKIKVTTDKFDVTRQADIVEEVLRIYGFNKVPVPSRVHASLSYHKKPNSNKIENNASNLLVGCGYLEAMNLSISNSKYYENLDWNGGTVVPLLNSLNADLDVMRGTMLYGGLESIKHNNNRQNNDLKLFEFGSIYWKDEDKFKESKQLAIFCSGNEQTESWRNKSEGTDFYNLKSTVNKLFSLLGKNKFETAETNNSLFEFGLSYTLNTKVIAEVGLVKSNILNHFDLKQAVYFADINWTNVLKALKKSKLKYAEISKFPMVRRDLALMIDDAVEFGSIKSIAEKNVKHILKSVNLFDIYKGDKMETGKKSYAVSFHFQDDKKTLTDKQVDKIMKQLISKFETEIGASLR